MGVKFKDEAVGLRVLLSGEIDHHTASGLCNDIDIKLMLSKPKTVLLDFGAVTFMDSSGLAVCAGRKRVCDRLGARIYIINISGYPEKILRMSGADKLIEILEDNNEN